MIDQAERPATPAPAMRPSLLRVAIVDDEPVARRGLRLFLSARPDVEIAGECRNGKEAVALMRREQIDVAFLDIQMPGLDGFGVLRTLGAEATPAVVFVTAFDEFAVRAFEVAAVDYVVKPYSDERLAHALDRAVERRRDRRVVAAHERLLEILADGAHGVRPAHRDRLTAEADRGHAARLLVSVGTRSVVVPLADVTLLQADGYHVQVWAGDARYTLRESLNELELRLDPAEFCRVHRSAIVRIGTVKSLERTREDRLFLLLAGGSKVPVSRSRRDAVIHALGSIRG